MVEKKYEVVWTKRSQIQMNAVFKHISKDSPQNALKVLEDIITAVHKADRNPEFYNPDKYKRNNDGSYRSFENHRYRIAYRFTGNTIRILRVRHTSMEPKAY
jgi:plasmid stabilization system protein ParE